MPDWRVVPDTTCLIALSAVSLLDLLDGQWPGDGCSTDRDPAAGQAGRVQI